MGFLCPDETHCQPDQCDVSRHRGQLNLQRVATVLYELGSASPGTLAGDVLEDSSGGMSSRCHGWWASPDDGARARCCRYGRGFAGSRRSGVWPRPRWCQGLGPFGWLRPAWTRAAGETLTRRWGPAPAVSNVVRDGFPMP